MSFSANRLSRLREAVESEGARAAYIRETPNIEWLTGFENVFDGERAHALFVGADCTRVHTDSRYITAMQREAKDTPVCVDDERTGMPAWACARWRESGAGKLAIEDTTTLHEYRALQRQFDNDCETSAGEARPVGEDEPFVETCDLVLSLRAVKDADELERMRKAQAVTDEAFAHIIGFIRPGMTEREVQLELDNFMLSHGAEALAFPSIVASGPNGASPHAVVSDKPLEAGECIVMDFGARALGYCSDMTRTVFLGAPEGEMLRAWETLRRANETVEEMLGPGVTGKEAHELALRVLDEGGFGGRMGHGLGHGVGLEIHELPVLSPRNEQPLVAGNVVTVEPGIYIPGSFGMRLEDFGVITESGFDVFTRSTHEMVVV